MIDKNIREKMHRQRLRMLSDDEHKKIQFLKDILKIHEETIKSERFDDFGLFNDTICSYIKSNFCFGFNNPSSINLDYINFFSDHNDLNFFKKTLFSEDEIEKHRVLLIYLVYLTNITSFKFLGLYNVFDVKNLNHFSDRLSYFEDVYFYILNDFFEKNKYIKFVINELLTFFEKEFDLSITVSNEKDIFLRKEEMKELLHSIVTNDFLSLIRNNTTYFIDGKEAFLLNIFREILYSIINGTNVFKISTQNNFELKTIFFHIIYNKEKKISIPNHYYNKIPYLFDELYSEYFHTKYSYEDTVLFIKNRPIYF